MLNITNISLSCISRVTNKKGSYYSAAELIALPQRIRWPNLRHEFLVMIITPYDRLAVKELSSYINADFHIMIRKIVTIIQFEEKFGSKSL